MPMRTWLLLSRTYIRRSLGPNWEAAKVSTTTVLEKAMLSVVTRAPIRTASMDRMELRLPAPVKGNMKPILLSIDRRTRQSAMAPVDIRAGRNQKLDLKESHLFWNQVLVFILAEAPFLCGPSL